MAKQSKCFGFEKNKKLMARKCSNNSKRTHTQYYTYILDDTHLFTYQAAWAKFNTLSQNLSFKPNYNQLS